MKTILLNPGPVTLSERVRQALLRDDLCHRETEFAELQNAIREKLLNVYALDSSHWAAALMTGSGTAAVEAMITSLVPQQGKLLIIENGVYGERITRIASRYGIDHVSVPGNWEASIDIEQIGRVLAAEPSVTHVAVVHHETTTGRLNDLAPVAKLCREHGAQILLDAVSSFGAEEINFDQWPIAGAAATANKCLHGVPGTCFVVVDRSVLANAYPRNLYLDLPTYIAAQDKAGTPFTQSVQTFYALDEALNELQDEGGVAERRKIYRARMGQIRNVLTGIGIKPFLDNSETSCVLHAYEIPERTNYVELHDRLKAAGFVIYAGQGPYAEKIFRLSMMGDITRDDLERLSQALVEALG